MKRLFAFALLVLFSCSIPLGVSAHDVPVERDDCSIEITVRCNNANVDGGTLTAIRVGYVAEEDGNYFFRRVSDDAVLEDIGSPEAFAAMDEYYAAQKGSYSFETVTADVEEGVCDFTGLSTGLYLIIQETAAPGFNPLGSFLVSVPRLVDGTYVYNVSSVIKGELEREADATEPPPTTVPAPTDPQLPQTGQLNWPVPAMAAAGVVLLMLGLVMRFGPGKDSYEK